MYSVNHSNKATCPRLKKPVRASRAAGFTLMELVIVLVIIGVMGGIAIMNFASAKRLQSTDDQAIRLMDFMRDAGIQALSKRRTFRLEIDVTDKELKLIDENGAGTTDDRLARWTPFDITGIVKVDSSTIPTGVTATGLPANHNAALFGTDTLGHWKNNTRITGHSVWSVRFRSDGSLVSNAGAVSSATLYLWPAKDGTTPNTPLTKSLVRAITLFGPTGSIKYWKYDGTKFNGG